MYLIPLARMVFGPEKKGFLNYFKVPTYGIKIDKDIYHLLFIINLFKNKQFPEFGECKFIWGGYQTYKGTTENKQTNKFQSVPFIQ